MACAFFLLDRATRCLRKHPVDTCVNKFIVNIVPPRFRYSIFVYLGVLLWNPGFAQSSYQPMGAANEPGELAYEFNPARLIYEPGPQSNWGPGRAWWRIDWPEAEYHFLGALRRYSLIDSNSDSVHVALTDEALFDYPWLWSQQPGRWGFSEDEVDALGEYLRRGGFLIVDDFHGPSDWAVFESTMQRALPGHSIVDLKDDPSLEIMFELDQRTQIPGRRHLVSTSAGQQARMPFGPPHWRGIRDEAGRLIVAINFNMDMGDAWEHADDPAYPVPMTAFAYRVGINYLTYALTH